MQSRSRSWVSHKGEAEELNFPGDIFFSTEAVTNPCRRNEAPGLCWHYLLLIIEHSNDFPTVTRCHIRQRVNPSTMRVSVGFIFSCYVRRDTHLVNKERTRAANRSAADLSSVSPRYVRPSPELTSIPRSLRLQEQLRAVCERLWPRMHWKRSPGGGGLTHESGL